MKKRKQLGQLPSHGGKAIKIPRYSFGVFTFVTKMQKPEPSGRRSLNAILQALKLNRFAIMKTTESTGTTFRLNKLFLVFTTILKSDFIKFINWN